MDMDKKNKEDIISKKNNEIHLKSIQTVKVIKGGVDNIYIYKNKNYLVKGHDNRFDNSLILFDYKKVLGPNQVKIYNKENNLIKEVYFRNDIHFIKILDNTTIMCLGDNIKLAKISLETYNVDKIYEFSPKIYNLLYYKKNYIITLDDKRNVIKIWKLKDNELKLETKICRNDMEYQNIFLIKNKDILATPCYKNECTLFWNLKLCKIVKKINYSFKKCAQLDEKTFIFVKYYKDDEPNSLDIYDYYENKIIKNINLDYSVICIETIPKKNIFLVGGGECSNYSNQHYDIHIYDYNFNKIQILKKLHERNIVGFKFYEKGENEDDVIFSYSEDGSINILEFMINH